MNVDSGFRLVVDTGASTRTQRAADDVGTQLQAIFSGVVPEPAEDGFAYGVTPGLGQIAQFWLMFGLQLASLGVAGAQLIQSAMADKARARNDDRLRKAAQRIKAECCDLAASKEEAREKLIAAVTICVEAACAEHGLVVNVRLEQTAGTPEAAHNRGAQR